jgi:hypothetical protein
MELRGGKTGGDKKYLEIRRIKGEDKQDGQKGLKIKGGIKGEEKRDETIKGWNSIEESKGRKSRMTQKRIEK